VSSFKERRWKLFGLSVVITFVLLASIYVYWRINAPSPSTLCVTATSPPLELRMELDKTDFQQGETIVVSLFLTNKGSEPVALRFTYLNGHVGFLVKDENDTEVYEYPNFYLFLADNLVLEPSEQITAPWDEPTEWNQKGNMPGKYYGLQVPPGTYKIIGRTGRVSINGESPSESGRIETPPITVTIAPPPHVTATYPPLELSMNLSKTAYQQGETIVVSLFLTNKGSEPVALSFAYLNDLVGFIVKDENDTEVYVHPIIHLCLVYDIVLEPGEQITSHWEDPTEWNQEGNLSGKYYGKLVPPGTYKIIGRTGYFGMVGEPGPESGRIETPPVAITIG